MDEELKEFFEIQTLLRLQWKSEALDFLCKEDAIGALTYDPDYFTLSIHDAETPGGQRVKLRWQNLIDKPTEFTPEYHNHDTQYYTESEIDAMLTDMATKTWVLGQNYLTSFTETDPVFTAWDKSTGIAITESQITDFGSYALSNHNHHDLYYTETEIDSMLSDMATKTWVNGQNYLTSYTETDPVFTAWDKSTGISITESQITDFGNYALSTHNHNTVYAAISHTHDSRYYTESEINSLLSDMATETWATGQFLSELPSHDHNRVERQPNYTLWYTDSPQDSPQFMMISTVSPVTGDWPHYGQVLHLPSWNTGSDDAAFQLLIPYESYGGDELKYRIGRSDDLGWTSLRTIWDSENLDLSTYATQAWVNAQGFLDSSDLSGYATQSWVTSQNYLDSSDISDMATQTWVNAQGFIVNGGNIYIENTSPYIRFEDTDVGNMDGQEWRIQQVGSDFNIDIMQYGGSWANVLKIDADQDFQINGSLNIDGGATITLPYSSGDFAVKKYDGSDIISILNNTNYIEVNRILNVTDKIYAKGDFCIQEPTVPATSTSQGTPGTIAWDSNYIYICIAAYTWRRVPLSW